MPTRTNPMPLASVAAAAATTLALSAMSAAASQVTTTDPGLYTDLDDALEARIRLDAGNSQTWKSAFWQGNTLAATSGNNQNVFGNGITESFSFTYDASTAQASLDVAGLTTTSTIALPTRQDLAGFRFFIVSETNTGTTVAENMTVALNGGSAQSIAGLTSGIGQRFVESDVQFFDAATTSLTVTGDLTFGWLDGANLQGERFKLSIKLLSGTEVPAPGAVAILGLGGMFATRRRR